MASAHLLSLEVLVQQVKRSLVGLSASHDGEHALTSVVMRCLSDADAGSGSLADLTDLATSAANDTSHHVRRNADILSLELLSVLIMGGRSTLRSIGIGAAVVVGSRSALAEVVAISGAHDPVVAVVVTAISSTLSHAWSSAWLGSDNRVVQHGTSSSLPIIYQALANLPNSLLNAFRVALNFDDSLSRLREHLLLCHHAHAGYILDMLNLETLSTNDRTHLIVRNQKFDC